MCCKVNEFNLAKSVTASAGENTTPWLIDKPGSRTRMWRLHLHFTLEADESRAIINPQKSTYKHTSLECPLAAVSVKITNM